MLSALLSSHRPRRLSPFSSVVRAVCCARWFDWSGSCSRPFQSTRATTATAHKLARVVYHLMRYGAAYVKRTEEQYAPREVREREEKRLKCKARALGYEVVKIEPDAPPAG